MKKSKFMRVAAILMAAVLLTTCAISGTFAKYVTSANGSDNARVAAWGVNVAVDGELFADEYAIAAATTDYAGNSITNSVEAATNVVAPGTSGTLAGYTVTGTPEVAVNVAFTGSLTLTGWEIGEAGSEVEYCPLVFTVNGTEIKMDATNDTVAKLVAAVNAAIGSASKNYAPGTNLATASAATGLAVSWEWPFSTTGNDANDTALGNLGTAPTIALTTTVTATQID